MQASEVGEILPPHWLTSVCIFCIIKMYVCVVYVMCMCVYVSVSVSVCIWVYVSICVC